MTPDGVKFVSDPRLAGYNKAITQDGRRYLVSPAFYSLLKGAATETESRALLASLKVIDTRLGIENVFSLARLMQWRGAVTEANRMLGSRSGRKC